MRAFIVIFLFGLLPLCTPLDCYVCVSGGNGCNDPFNAAGTGVTMMNSSTYAYCMKTKVAGIVVRSGVSSCVAVRISSSTVTTCCQTDLCNGARGQYQTSIVLVLSIFVILIKFKWV